MSVTQPECVCLEPEVSCMQCACAISSFFACPTVHYFFTFSHMVQFSQKKLLNTKWVLLFSPQCLSETFLIVRRYERNMTNNAYWSSRPIFMKLEFLDIFFFLKNHEMSNFMKIRPVGAKLSHVDGQMDRHDEANSHFSQFCVHA